MFSGKVVITTGLVTIAGLLPIDSHASLVPQAATSSNQILTATIDGSSLLFGAVSAKTNAYSMAISTFPGSLTYPAVHLAESSAMVAIPANLNNTIGTFYSSFDTSATAIFSSPLFSRSTASGQGSIYAWVSPSESSNLNLDWQINQLSLKAEPTSTFSYMSDVVNVVRQTTQGLVRETVAGFYTFLENGKQTMGFLGDNAVSQTFKNWFDDNTVLAGNQLRLNNSAVSLSVDISLPKHESPFFIGIETFHTEASYEAPPVATNRVDERIGYSGVGPNSNQLHWDADTGTLSFDRLPINKLTTFFGSQYPDDPLSGGYLEIDPLQLMTQADDGRDYFSGKEIRLFDNNDNVIFRASLPSIVFDDAIFDKEGFNIFAPILNILEADPNASKWLKDYLSKATIDSLLLPELFIGFDPEDEENIWNDSFSAPVKSYLSFAGVQSVPEPGELMLLALGFLALALTLRKRRINS